MRINIKAVNWFQSFAVRAMHRHSYASFILEVYGAITTSTKI